MWRSRLGVSYDAPPRPGAAEPKTFLREHPEGGDHRQKVLPIPASSANALMDGARRRRDDEDYPRPLLQTTFLF